MSDYEKRFQAAVAELHKKGVWRSNAVPPVIRLVRHLGFKPRPPHYAEFWRYALISALWFSFAWGSVMYLLQWRADGVPITVAVMVALFAGTLFGLAMAMFMGWTRKRKGLSKWADL